MAESTTKKSSSKKKEAAVAEEVVTAATVVPKEVDVHQYITVRNGFHGKLVYKSKRTGELFIWDEYGDEQELELQELKGAKSSSKTFFINNWFMFNEDDAWVIDYLGMKQYYKYAIDIDNFDVFFSKPVAELKKSIASMPDGLKRSVSYRARTLIADGEIDSIKVISALEEALGVELIEH